MFKKKKKIIHQSLDQLNQASVPQNTEQVTSGRWGVPRDGPFQSGRCGSLGWHSSHSPLDPAPLEDPGGLPSHSPFSPEVACPASRLTSAVITYLRFFLE